MCSFETYVTTINLHLKLATQNLLAVTRTDILPNETVRVCPISIGESTAQYCSKRLYLRKCHNVCDLKLSTSLLIFMTLIIIMTIIIIFLSHSITCRIQPISPILVDCIIKKVLKDSKNKLYQNNNSKVSLLHNYAGIAILSIRDAITYTKFNL